MMMTVTSATVAKWLNREMDAVLSGIFDLWKNPSEITHLKTGSQVTDTMDSNA